MRRQRRTERITDIPLWLANIVTSIGWDNRGNEVRIEEILRKGVNLLMKNGDIEGMTQMEFKELSEGVRIRMVIGTEVAECLSNITLFISSLASRGRLRAPFSPLEMKRPPGEKTYINVISRIPSPVCIGGDQYFTACVWVCESLACVNRCLPRLSDQIPRNAIFLIIERLSFDFLYVNDPDIVTEEIITALSNYKSLNDRNSFHNRADIIYIIHDILLRDYERTESVATNLSE